MAIPTGWADERDIYRALVVDAYTDVSWDEYLRRRSRADTNTGHAGSAQGQRAVADGGQLAVDLPDLNVGDHVVDREDEDGATMLVVGTPVESADEYHVDGDPVSKYNPEYPETDDVVEVIYPQRTDVDLSEKTYAFPRSRVRLEAAIHDVDEDEEGER